MVVDLTVRVFALLRIAGLKPPRPETPKWAEENGGGKLLSSHAFVPAGGPSKREHKARPALARPVSHSKITGVVPHLSRP